MALDQNFDAVVGRWVLTSVPDPVALLRQAGSWLHPGGIVAFQELDLSHAPRAFPVGPLYDEVVRWTMPPPGVPGPDPFMGLKLFKAFLEAGLPAAQLRRAALGRGWARLAGLHLCGRHGAQPAAVPGAVRRSSARGG